MPVVAIYEKGPGWDEVRPQGEQDGIAGHVDLMDRLEREGRVTHAGPFHAMAETVTGAVVGMVIFSTDDVEAARRLAGADPAVAGGLMTVTIRRWDP